MNIAEPLATEALPQVWPPPGIKWYYHDQYTCLFNGDCRELLPNLPPMKVQLISDPPFGIGLQPQRRITKAIVGDGNRDDAKELTRFVGEWLNRTAPEDSAHFVFAGWSEWWVQQMLEEWFTIKACIIWKKNMFGIGYHTRPQHEFIYLVHKGNPPAPENASSDIWEFDKVRNPAHSCEKPVDLLMKCVQYYPSDAVVIDPFGGSGTTGVAAKQLLRRSIVCELEEEYCQLAADRMGQGVLALA